MAMTCRELRWLTSLLRDLCVPLTGPTPLFCDNQATQHIASNPVFLNELSIFGLTVTSIVKNYRLIGLLLLIFSIDAQPGEITQALGASQFPHHLGKLRICNLPTPN